MLFVVRVASLRCVVAFYVVASIAQGRFSASHISFEEQRGATGKNLLRLNTTQVSYQPHHSKLNYSRCTKAVPRYSSIDGKLLDRRHDKFLPDHSMFWPKINLGPCSTTTKISSPYPGTRRKGWRTDDGRRTAKSKKWIEKFNWTLGHVKCSRGTDRIKIWIQGERCSYTGFALRNWKGIDFKAFIEPSSLVTITDLDSG